MGANARKVLLTLELLPPLRDKASRYRKMLEQKILELPADGNIEGLTDPELEGFEEAIIELTKLVLGTAPSPGVWKRCRDFVRPYDIANTGKGWTVSNENYYAWILRWLDQTEVYIRALGKADGEPADTPEKEPDVVILLLAANPFDGQRLDLEEEIRAIQGELRSAEFRDRMALVPCLAARTDDLVKALTEFRPQIVHFCGHGSSDGISLRGDQGTEKLVRGEALSRVFNQRDVKVVVLNACYTASQALPIQSSVKVVVGTTSQLRDSEAVAFSKAFYREVGNGRTVAEAFRDGRDVVALNNGNDVFTAIGEMSLRLFP